MILGCSNVSIGLNAVLLEAEINRDASTYVSENYSDLITFIKKQDIKDEKAQDLLHDVYISLVENENNGEGFDMEYGAKIGASESSNVMNVAQFVKGRIKLYAKNTKYRTDVVESGKIKVTECTTTYSPELDSLGNEVLNADGKPKLTKLILRTKREIKVDSHAASFDDGCDSMDNNDSFQKAFALAAVADSTDDITELLSVREQLDYCISFCDLHDFKILNLFKNLDKLACMLGNMSYKKKSADSIFGKLTDLVNEHDEFAKALTDVLLFSAKERCKFNNLIAQY